MKTIKHHIKLKKEKNNKHIFKMTMATCYANYDMVTLGTYSLHNNNGPQSYSQHQQYRQQHQQEQQNAYSVHHQQYTSNRLSESVMAVSTATRNTVGDCHNLSIINTGGISTQSYNSIQQRNTGSININFKNKSNNINTTNKNASISALTPPSNVNSTEVTCSVNVSSKDYTIPLHVDCSVEYELPNQPKPPIGQRVEPLLMIHPCYFRKIESQRRSPFVNNMPASAALRTTAVTLVGNITHTGVGNTSVSAQNSLAVPTVKRIRQQKTQVIQQQHAQSQRQTVGTAVTIKQYRPQLHNQQQFRHAQQQSQQQHMSQMSQQAHYPVLVSHQQQQNYQQNSLSQLGNTTDTATVAITSPYLDQQTNLVIRRSGNHKISRQQSYTNQSQPQRLLSEQTNSQCDQITAAVITARSNVTPVHIINTYNQTLGANQSESNRNTITEKVTNMVGKRDAMISGSAAYFKGSNSYNNKYQQHHSDASLPSMGSIWIGESNHEATTTKSANTDMSCNTNAISLKSSINPSPIATIPNNFQAGPDTTPVDSQIANTNSISCDYHNYRQQNCSNQVQRYQQYQHQYTPNNSSNNNDISNNNNNNNNNSNTQNRNVDSSLHHHQQQQQYSNKLTGKYRQYLKAQRLHPYITAATTASNLGQTLTQFTVATAAVVAAATPSLQHLQQISCYNV